MDRFDLGSEDFNPPARGPRGQVARNFQKYVEQKRAAREREEAEYEQRGKALDERLLGMKPAERAKVLQKYEEAEDQYLVNSRHKWCTDHFETLRVIGKGSFGTVRLVRKHGDRDPTRVYACKQMLKAGMTQKNHRDRVFAERQILAEAQDTNHAVWLVKLHHTFQDKHNIYMVMEFLCGGDMMSHMERLTFFDDRQAKFYTAELIEAVDCVHALGFIHRDLKPENIVFTAKGHLKLLDFGLCKYQSGDLQWLDERLEGLPPLLSRPTEEETFHQRDERQSCPVGTPQYMAPEVIQREKYGKEVDWWGVGIILYEMYHGGPPFQPDRRLPTGQQRKQIWTQVKNWQQYVKIPHPEKPNLQEDVKELLRGWISDPKTRLTAEQARQMDFFHDLGLSGVKNWTHELQRMTPAIRPNVKGADDVSQFIGQISSMRLKNTPLPKYDPEGSGIDKDKYLQFACYTFNADAKREPLENLIEEALDRPSPAAVLQAPEPVRARDRTPEPLDRFARGTLGTLAGSPERLTPDRPPPPVNGPPARPKKPALDPLDPRVALHSQQRTTAPFPARTPPKRPSPELTKRPSERSKGR